jgi:hypothetical protein
MIRHRLRPMRHTRHGFLILLGGEQGRRSDASSGWRDALSDASETASPQVVTLMTLVTLSRPFHHHACAHTRTGRHTELRVTSVIRHPKRHRGPL